MKKRTHWAWKVYLVIFSLGALINLYSLLSGESSTNQYYKILISFKPSFAVYHYLYVSHVVINTLCLVPFFLFTFHIRFLWPIVWQVLFFTRIFFFCTGHSYEWQVIRAFFYTDPVTIIIAGILFTLFTLPSFIACFEYAFYQEKLLS